MELSVKINQIPQKQVTEIWPFVCHFIIDACHRSQGIDALDLYRRCISGKAQLWATHYTAGNSPTLFCGAGVTKLSRNSNDDLVCTIITYASDPKVNWSHWTHIIGEVEKWAQLERCNLMEIYGRKGWVRRLHDYSVFKHLPEKRVVLHKELK